jgi:hypothetical protein
MSLIYEKNISKIHDEYTLRVTEMLQSYIYEGILHIFDKSQEMYAQLLKLYNTGYKKKSPPRKDIVFQNLLATTKDWSKDKIMVETNRIKLASEDSVIFDLLIKALIKSNITLFTCGYSMRETAEMFNDYYNKIDIGDVIHKCYIYTAKRFYNNVELFVNDSKELSATNIKEIKRLINEGISEGIWKSLPLENVLNGYLNLKPIYEDTNIEDFKQIRMTNLKSQLNNDLKHVGSLSTNVPNGAPLTMQDPKSSASLLPITKKNQEQNSDRSNMGAQSKILNISNLVNQKQNDIPPNFMDRTNSITKVNNNKLNSFHSRPEEINRSVHNNQDSSKLNNINRASEGDNYSVIDNDDDEDDDDDDEDDDESSDENNDNQSDVKIKKALLMKLNNTLNVNQKGEKQKSGMQNYKTLEEFSNSAVYRNNN